MTTNDKLKLVLFDLDGTVYLDGRLIPGATDFFARLDDAGVQYAYMTNNSSQSPKQYVKKLQTLGLNATPDNILTSCEATLLMLRDLDLGPELFVLGTGAFREFLTENGYQVEAANPKAVLVGFDKELDYDRLTRATRLLTDGVPLVASHPDMLCPSSEGPLPDAGVLLAAFKAAANAKPIAIAGKPHRWIVSLAREKFKVACRNMAVIGDRLATDIRMANRNKMRSVLVLTGVTKKEELAVGRIQPTLVVNSIADLAGPSWPGDLGWL